jgi:hypothetical protein
MDVVVPESENGAESPSVAIAIRPPGHERWVGGS